MAVAAIVAVLVFASILILVIGQQTHDDISQSNLIAVTRLLDAAGVSSTLGSEFSGSALVQAPSVRACHGRWHQQMDRYRCRSRTPDRPIDFDMITARLASARPKTMP